MPEASVIRGVQALPGIIGRKGLGRRFIKFLVKALDSIEKMLGILIDWRKREESGICGVGVKSVDLTRNTKCEGSFLALS